MTANAHVEVIRGLIFPTILYFEIAAVVVLVALYACAWAMRPSRVTLPDYWLYAMTAKVLTEASRSGAAARVTPLDVTINAVNISFEMQMANVEMILEQSADSTLHQQPA